VAFCATVLAGLAIGEGRPTIPVDLVAFGKRFYFLDNSCLHVKAPTFAFCTHFGSASEPMSVPCPVHEVTPLQTDRVKFTPLQMENIHTHFHWNNDSELNRLDSEVPYEEETFGQFKNRFEQMCVNPSPSQRTFEVHAIDDEEERLIGVVYATRISMHNLHAQVGITIGNRDYWGRGYGRASFELLLSYCFEQLGLHRVSAETFEYHTAWQDLVEGMGFQREGMAREYLRRDGRYWDKELYSLLEAEYRARRAEAKDQAPVETTA